MIDILPVLLPPSSIPKDVASTSEWRPTRHLLPPQPPPTDESKVQEQAMANARQLMDGKVVKKTRPRRTVDYMGGLGRWNLHRKQRPCPNYLPSIRPAPPYIIDLLPPKAYPNNLSTSLCTKFVHTSTNKIRCPVNCVTWTPEGRRVLTGSMSGEFTLWNGLTFNFETILQAHDSAVRTMSFTHSGAYLASADQNGIIKYFQPNMNNLTAWNGHREAIRGLSFSPDDRMFATASDDSNVTIWSFEESREVRILKGHGWDVRCVQWHPSKGLIVSGSKDNLVKFWDPRTGTCLSSLHQHKNTIQDLAWSPNGDYLASASRDQTVRVFDIRAMKEYRVLKGHKKEVCSLAWHPIHPILVSGGSEGALLYWDINAPEHKAGSSLPGGPRATLSQAHDSNVWAMAFHPLGHLLVSASNDHTTRFWSRERPGDATSVFSGGGEKPPPAALDGGGQDEDEDAALPGFAYVGSGGAPVWMENGKEEQDEMMGLPGLPGLRTGTAPFVVDQGYSVVGQQQMQQPPFGGYPTAGVFNGASAELSGQDSMIPGFGSSMNAVQTQPMIAGRQSGPLPSQQDMYVSGASVGDEWSGTGRSGGGRGSRWGPPRGGAARY